MNYMIAHFSIFRITYLRKTTKLVNKVIITFFYLFLLMTLLFINLLINN
jgi:hypothetical protein